MAVAVAEGPGWALVVTGHAVGGNAARLKWAQKEELEEILSRPPSEAGVKAGFWDVPAP